MKASYNHVKMNQEAIQTGIPIQNIQLQPTNVQPNFVEGKNNSDNNNEQVGNVIAEDALIQGLAPYLQNIFLSKIAVIWFIQEVLMVLVCTKFHNFSVYQKNSFLETLMLYFFFICLLVFTIKVRFSQPPSQSGEQLKILIIFTLGYCLCSVLYIGEISGFATFYYFLIIGNCISFFEIILITLVCPNGQYYKKFLIAQLIFQVIPLTLFALRLFYYQIFEGILIPFAVLCFGFGMVSCTTLTGLYLLYSVDTLLKGKFELRRNQAIIGAVLAFSIIL